MNSRYQREKKPPPQQLALSLRPKRCSRPSADARSELAKHAAWVSACVLVSSRVAPKTAEASMSRCRGSYLHRALDPCM